MASVCIRLPPSSLRLVFFVAPARRCLELLEHTHAFFRRKQDGQPCSNAGHAGGKQSAHLPFPSRKPSFLDRPAMVIISSSFPGSVFSSVPGSTTRNVSIGQAVAGASEVPGSRRTQWFCLSVVQIPSPRSIAIPDLVAPDAESVQGVQGIKQRLRGRDSSRAVEATGDPVSLGITLYRRHKGQSRPRHSERVARQRGLLPGIPHPAMLQTMQSIPPSFNRFTSLLSSVSHWS